MKTGTVVYRTPSSIVSAPVNLIAGKEYVGSTPLTEILKNSIWHTVFREDGSEDCHHISVGKK